MRVAARVRVPVTLRTDVATACGDGAALLDAVNRGLWRALGRAHAALRDPAFDGECAFRSAGVTVRWSGPGCDRVPAAARERLERALRDRIGEAVAPPRISGAWGGPAGAGGRRWDEPASASRWTDAGDYLIPSYDQSGSAVPVAADAAPAPAVSTFEDVLYPFTSFEEVLEAIQRFFTDHAPRDNRMFGVYGVWVPTGQPTLFWLKAIPAFIRTQSYVSVKTHEGQVISSHHPIGYDVKQTYKLYVLPKAKHTNGVEYWLEQCPLHGTRKQAAILNHLRDELRGREIHFRVAIIRQENIFIEGKASGERPGMPPWQLFGVSSLGWQPDNGVSDGAWEWIAWLNIVPIEVRQDPIVKRIVEQWAVDKPSLNILFIYLHVNEFYRNYCFHAALEMVAESRRNMEDFLKVLQQPDHPWAGQFDTLVRHMSATGLQVSRMQSGLAGRYEYLLNTLRDTLKYREGLYQQQVESAAAGRGGLPGGIIRLDELEEMRAEIARVEAERDAAATELPKWNATIGAAQSLQPLLVVLTIRDGRDVTDLAGALARYAPADAPQSDAEARVYGGSDAGRYWYTLKRTAERPSDWVRREFASLIQLSLKAEQNMRENPDKVYQVGLVRQVVDKRLEPWFAANPIHRDSVKKMIEGPGILGWIIIGVALLAITLACPPLGLTLSAGIGSAQLVSSVGQYRRFKVYSRVRLAQHGFIPLVSPAEVNGALLAVVLDTVFLFLDAKGLVGAARAAGAARGAARATLDGFEQAMERLLASVRRTGAWPESLTTTVRRKIEELAKREGALAGRTIDEAVEVAKAEMALRYERHLLDVKDELARLLERPDLTGDELQRWLTQRMRNPVDVLDELAQELKEGAELWEGVAGKLRAGPPPRGLAAGFEFLPKMSEEAERALKAELGTLAETLTPDRLLRLGLDLRVPYPDLARRLKTLLARAPDPGRSLQLLEDICRGRPDAQAILRALETQARPAALLELLSPTLLGGVPGMSVQELFEAMSRETAAGTIERFYIHTRVGGEVVLARDIVSADGKVMVQRWAGGENGWKVQRGWGPRPTAEIGAAARRAAEASTLASVVEGHEQATLGLARLSQPGRRVLLEGLEDTALDPALARRLLEEIQALPERSLNALVAIQRAEAATGGLGTHTWLDVFEHSQGWRNEMLRLVGELHDVVDNGLAEAVRRGMSGATNIQGSLGHMHAAATLRRQFPKARMSFEVDAVNREIDIVLHDGARNIDVEVKTNLGNELSINRRQMRNDLTRHAADQGHDLLYLYHPDAAARLEQVRAALIEEAVDVLDQAGAAEVALRINEIVTVYQLY